jgi:NADH-quinone oxidoreductase subunit N
MSLAELLRESFHETFRVSLPLFTPELGVVATIVLLLSVRLVRPRARLSGHRIALFGTLLSLGFAVSQLGEWLTATGVSGVGRSVPLFGGLLVFDGLTAFLRVYLLLFAMLVVWLTTLSGVPDRDDAPDFYTLLLGSLLGLLVLASANHWLMVFLGVEMASLPSYALAGFLKGRRAAGEASLKYMVYGAGAAGVMLYGISLLMGLLGTGSLSGMEFALPQLWEQPGMSSAALSRTLMFALVLIFCGLAFKLAAVPFQFWCPDVFQGASAEVALALSVASKAGAVAVLIRIALALVGAFQAIPGAASLGVSLGVGLAVIAGVTTTFGNLAAFPQTNLKRLLAYSTIAQAGYLLMGVAAIMVIDLAPLPAGASPSLRLVASADALEAVLLYLVVYCFMKLGAFAVVVAVRNRLFSEELADWGGLARRHAGLAICLSLCLFSLTGLPPLGGFVAKVRILFALYEAGRFHPVLWGVMAVGALNTVISLVYYLRVLRIVYFAPLAGRLLTDYATPELDAASRASIAPLIRFAALVTLPVVLLGVVVDPVLEILHRVAVGAVR